MVDNPCLRPARLSDLVETHYTEAGDAYFIYLTASRRVRELAPLYDAEWRKRGFPRSP